MSDLIMCLNIRLHVESSYRPSMKVKTLENGLPLVDLPLHIVHRNIRINCHLIINNLITNPFLKEHYSL